MKGQYQQECYRTACNNTNAVFYNHSTTQYYCPECAKMINSVNYDDAMRLYGHQLCTYGEHKKPTPERIITVSSDKKKQYFFSTNHCQPHKLGEDWVSMTISIPFSVVPREGLESGVITNKEEYKHIFCKDYNEIPNPQPEYQA